MIKALGWVLPAILLLSTPAPALSATSLREPAPIHGSFPAYFVRGNLHRECPRDSDGIVMVVYDGVPQYNPVTIAQAALAYYNDWVSTVSSVSRATFLAYADWLVYNQTEDGLWLYHFAFQGETPPWWSAMAEGQGISVLIRAFDMTRRQSYLAAAQLALATFARPTSSRGVASIDNGTWYEEYRTAVHPNVLNGMIFAMFGPYEYYRRTGDRNALVLWNAGVRTLANNLWRFDSGSWSYYDTGKWKASASYHSLHIFLLGVMFEATGIRVFDYYRARFQKYKDEA